MFDEKAEPAEDGCYEIYHLVLESNEPTDKFGIFANGILSESLDEKHYILTKNKNMMKTLKINQSCAKNN